MTELVLLTQAGPWQEISIYEATAHKLFASSPNMHGMYMQNINCFFYVNAISKFSNPFRGSQNYEHFHPNLVTLN